MDSPISPVEAEENFQQGTVIEVSAGMARVSTQEETLLCTIRQSLREHETGFTNVIAVGDEVLLNFKTPKEAVIESVLPRKSILARMYRPNKGKMSDKRQIVAVNIDQVIIVASWREPKLWPELIDRYLIVAQLNDLTPILCVNKIDLVKDQKEFEAAILPYQLLGIQIAKTSTESGKGMDNFRSLYPFSCFNCILRACLLTPSTLQTIPASDNASSTAFRKSRLTPSPRPTRALR